MPTVPSFTIIGRLIFPDALIIAIVAYVISVSMAKIFANKHNYSIDANQELVAQVSLRQKLMNVLIFVNKKDEISI